MTSKEDVPDSKAVKFEGITSAITSSFGVGYAVGVGDANRRRDMVSKPLWRINESDE